METDAKGGVFEVKFPLEPRVITPVIEWMRAALQPDPHGTGPARDAYVVQSVYLDTSAFDVFHRRGSFGRAKFRIRRYGDEEAVFLERKLKRSGVVRKRRVPVPPNDLDFLKAETNGLTWPGAWFHHRLTLRQLRPVVRMSYFRIARLGFATEGRFRVTLDRELRAEPVDGFTVPCRLQGADLLREGAVMEVKFVDTLPAPVKQLAEQLGLGAGALSKYRLGVRACGLVADAEVSADDESPGAPRHV